MRFKEWFYLNILPPVAWTVMNLTTITIRTKIIGEEKIDPLRQDGKKLIYIFWHGRQFLLIRYLSKLNLAVMSSTSRDGMVQSKILKKFHFEIIPGSSSKTPVKALIKSLRKMQQGFNFAITVEGPRGPIYKVKPGALYLAKKTDGYLIPMIFSSSPARIFKAWDRYLLPMPFSRAVILFGEPFKPSSGLDEQTIQLESLELEETLNDLTKRADTIVRLH